MHNKRRIIILLFF